MGKALAALKFVPPGSWPLSAVSGRIRVPLAGPQLRAITLLSWAWRCVVPLPCPREFVRVAPL